MDIAKIINQYPADTKLRDGTPLHLKLMGKKDIKNVYQFFLSIPAKEKINLKENVTDKKAITEWWQRIKNGVAVTVLADIEGNLAAEATLHQQAASWAKHVGDIRINIAPKYRGMGIATVLCEKICWIARNINIDKIMAEFIEEQATALQVFKALGFEREALLRDHVRDIAGKKHDLIILANHTDKLLKNMQTHSLYTDPRSSHEY